jgi:two-component system chemotaxis response regulator CheY
MNTSGTAKFQLPKELINGWVLIVDDISFYNSLVTQALTQFGFVGKIFFASGIQDAVEKIRQHLNQGIVFDLVVSDLHLSDGKGVDLIRNIRLNEATQNITTILMTTDSEKKNILLALELGADHFVLKPLVVEKFYSAIIFAWNKRHNN